MRLVRRKMSYEAFRDYARQLGWKYEYLNGWLYMTPAHVLLQMRLRLSHRDATSSLAVRPVNGSDEPSLRRRFIEAFRGTMEFIGHTRCELEQAARDYMRRFFGDEGGPWSSASVAAEANRRIIAAALVKDAPEGATLDCLFVKPSHQRRGIATVLASHVVNTLLARAESKMFSRCMLGNDASLAWHTRFGFQEVPEWRSASHRARIYGYDLERHRRLKDLPAVELARLGKTAEFWRVKARRLERAMSLRPRGRAAG